MGNVRVVVERVWTVEVRRRREWKSDWLDEPAGYFMELAT
jgi:hypothetical protein